MSKVQEMNEAIGKLSEIEHNLHQMIRAGQVDVTSLTIYLVCFPDPMVQIHMERMVREIIIRLLEDYEQNVQKAADHLGIGRKALESKINELKIPIAL